MATVADLLSNMGTVLSSVFEWCGDAVTFIIGQPILVVPMLISVVSAVTLGIVTRLIRG